MNNRTYWDGAGTGLRRLLHYKNEAKLAQREFPCNQFLNLPSQFLVFLDVQLVAN